MKKSIIYRLFFVLFMVGVTLPMQASVHLVELGTKKDNPVLDITGTVTDQEGEPLDYT